MVTGLDGQLRLGELRAKSPQARHGGVVANGLAGLRGFDQLTHFWVQFFPRHWGDSRHRLTPI